MRNKGKPGHAELLDCATRDPSRHAADGTLLLQAVTEDIGEFGQSASSGTSGES